jgi:benzoylformate decarboxylase
VETGRDILFRYLDELGVDCLFGVPGTNEIPIIDGTSVPGSPVRYIPCLHENIAVGAAMGYARASGKPGLVELHVTPGAGHGIGNLYNAFKSHVPLVILCAQQHNELLLQEPLLASDLVQVARQYAKWAYEVRFPDEFGMVLQRAFKEALTPPQRPVFISIPWEFTLAPVAHAPSHVTRIGPHIGGDPETVKQAADRLAKARSPIVVAGDGVGAAEAWDEIAALALQLGAPVYSESFSSFMNFPNKSPHWQGELPQTQEQMQTVFSGHDVVFLCGYNAQAQVLLYKYELGPLIPADVAQVYLHDDAWEIGKNAYGEVAVLGGIKTTLQVLLEDIPRHPAYEADAASSRVKALQAVDERRQATFAEHREILTAQSGPEAIAADKLATELAALQAEMSAPLMLSNEAVSNAALFQRSPTFERPNDYFLGQGGSLGWSMPASLGMKLARGEERTVVNVVGDGSALFYPHTWWTASKFELPILYVITNNREYRTLLMGLEKLEQVYAPWKTSGDPWYLRLDDPPMDFAALAAPFGIQGRQISTVGDLPGALREGLKAVEGGRPYVLDAVIDPNLTTPPRFDALLAEKEGADAVAKPYVGPA